MSDALKDHPLGSLPREDLDLLLRFALASGSLKALAREVGVSYPTIRARLDRLISRLQEVVAGRAPDPLVEELANLVEVGELSTGGARRLRDTYLRRLDEFGRGMTDG
jgi:hypothetical protein